MAQYQYDSRFGLGLLIMHWIQQYAIGKRVNVKSIISSIVALRVKQVNRYLREWLNHHLESVRK